MGQLKKEVSNPGSALGEAIGVLIENALNKILEPIARKNDCVYVTTGPKNSRTLKDTKLLLRDSNGVEYNIDAVIANKKLQPLVLIESKYIRYKKHNRDKGSWVCTAHQALRKRFSSVRSSVAILAGSWSKTSKAMMKSCDVTLFAISFDAICDALKEFAIDFRWDEKDRDKAYAAWNTFVSLQEEKRNAIGSKLVGLISAELYGTISDVLDETIPRAVQQVEIQVTTTLGETKVYMFDSVAKALEFLRGLDEEKILSTENAPSLFDNANVESLGDENDDGNNKDDED